MAVADGNVESPTKRVSDRSTDAFPISVRLPTVLSRSHRFLDVSRSPVRSLRVCVCVCVCVYIYMYIIRVHFHIAEPPLRFSRLLKMKTMYVCTRSALKLVIWTFHREQFRFRNSSSHGSPVSYHWNGFQSHGAWKCN